MKAIWIAGGLAVWWVSGSWADCLPGAIACASPMGREALLAGRPSDNASEVFLGHSRFGFESLQEGNRIKSFKPIVQINKDTRLSFKVRKNSGEIGFKMRF